MAKDYKLCPKCNNALDNNVIQCPYCGERMGINFGYENIPGNTATNKTTTPSNASPEQTMNKKGCLIIFIIMFIVPFIISIISFIIGLISSLLN